MHKTMMLLLAFVLSSFGAYAEDETNIVSDVTLSVTNVTFQQRYPWNGLVDISCEVLCSDPSTNVNLYLSAKDNVANRPLAMRHVWLENDATHTNALEVKAGKHRLVWDAEADVPNTVSTNVAISLQAFVGSGLYMVIDLSGGPDADSYPVSYMTEMPHDGWTDEYKTSKLVLRRILPASFMMGSPNGEVGRRIGTDTYQNVSETLHEVVLSMPYYIGVFEVTQAQWRNVMGTNPSSYTGEQRPVECVSYDQIRGAALGAQWPASSAVDEQSFMGRLRERTQLDRFDLPTEAQWEYACRAGTTTAMNNGCNLEDSRYDLRMSEVARYASNVGDGRGGYSSAHTSVGSYYANEWGLYDMHGNVWEWVLDWRGEYRVDQICDPVGPASGTNRSIRGGSCACVAGECRSAVRCWGDNPSYGSWYDCGFRVCCSERQLMDNAKRIARKFASSVTRKGSKDVSRNMTLTAAGN